MAGRWRMASVQIAFAAMPALIYLFAGLSIARARRRSRSGPWSPSPRSRRGSSSRSSRCSRSASTSRARWRSSSASSSTSTSRSRSASATARALDSGGRGPAAQVTFEGVGFRYAADGDWTLRDIDLDGARRDHARARRRDGRGQDDARLPARAALRRRRRARVTIDGIDVRDSHAMPRWQVVGVVSQETYLFHASIAGEPALRAAGRDRRRDRGGRARGADPRPDRVAARGLRHGRRRARLPLLGRREAADRDRARASCATRRS